MRTFPLVLHSAYYDGGFFNVRVDYDSLVPKVEGPITIFLGDSGRRLEGRIDRHTNSNGTARIRVGSELKNWFQQHFGERDTVLVTAESDGVLRITMLPNSYEKRPNKPLQPTPGSVTPRASEGTSK